MHEDREIVGRVEKHEAELFRCRQCGRVRTWREIEDVGFCVSCHSKYVVPALPTWWEIIKLFFREGFAGRGWTFYVR